MAQTTSDITNGAYLRFSSKGGSASGGKSDIVAVVEFQHVNPGKGSAFVRARLKSLTSGKVVEQTWKAGEILDGEGGYTVWGKLFPAEKSIAYGGLPLGLAHNVKLLKPIAAGQPLRWSDVACDETLLAVRVRREMERTFATPERAAA